MYRGIYLHFHHSRSKRSLKKKKHISKELKKIWIIIHSIFLLSFEYLNNISLN